MSPAKTISSKNNHWRQTEKLNEMFTFCLTVNRQSHNTYVSMTDREIFVFPSADNRLAFIFVGTVGPSIIPRLRRQHTNSYRYRIGGSSRRIISHWILGLTMRGDIDHLDEQIDRLRNGGTLTENEVKILCDKVSSVCALPVMIMDMRWYYWYLWVRIW